MYNKINFSIGELVTKEAEKNALLVAKNKTVALDGRVLIEISSLQDSGLPDFVISKKDAKEISKLAKNCEITVSPADVAGKYLVSAGDMVKTVTKAVALDGAEYQYPKYEKVIPEHKQDNIRIMLNADFMRTVCDAVIEINKDDECPYMILEISSPDKAVRIDSESESTGQKMRAIIMPARID